MPWIDIDDIDNLAENSKEAIGGDLETQFLLSHVLLISLGKI